MQTAVVNESGAEVMYGDVTNVAGQTLTTGNAVSICTLAASVNGNNAVLSQDNNRRSFAGIAAEDIADTASGRVVFSGYAASTLVFAVGTSVTLTLDDACGPGEAASLGVNSTGLDDTYGPVIALETITTSADTYFRCWVRAM